MIIQNGVGITSLLNGETLKQTLNPANETVSKGIYVATTLSAVDGDLATANIKNGITMFGFAGDADVQDISDATAIEAEVINGETFYAVAGGIRTGTMPIVALNAGANAYPAGYHVGAASLTAVDGDLAAGNIADGITIFGVLGTFTGGALAEDTSTESVTAFLTLQSSTCGANNNEIAGAGGEETLVTSTPTFAADSLAFIGACCLIRVNNVDVKLRLYVDAVQKEEYTFPGTNDSYPAILSRFEALSGAITVHVTGYNYNAGMKWCCQYGYSNIGSQTSVMMAIGSVKKV